MTGAPLDLDAIADRRINAKVAMARRAFGWSLDVYTALNDIPALIAEIKKLRHPVVTGQPLDLDAITERWQASDLTRQLSLILDSHNDHIPALVAEVLRLRGVLTGVLGDEQIGVDVAMELDEALHGAGL